MVVATIEETNCKENSTIKINNKLNRKKRLYFNIIGTIFNDAVLYDNKLLRLKLKSTETLNLVKAQTTLFHLTTTDVMHNTIKSQNKNIVKISKNAENIQTEILNLNSLTHRNSLKLMETPLNSWKSLTKISFHYNYSHNSYQTNKEEYLKFYLLQQVKNYTHTLSAHPC